MATYRVLSWRDIPSQVKATDDGGETVSRLMPGAFQAEIDRVAMAEGVIGSDAYLEAWNWSDEATRDGPAQEVAEAVVGELAMKWEQSQGLH